MPSSIQLNEKNLSLLPKEVTVPDYDRSKIKTGIVHIGVGNFHRAHQAFYTDQILNQQVTEWGICGIGLLESDAKTYQAMTRQNELYTLVVKKPDGTLNIRVIGSIIEYIYAPKNYQAALEKMTDINLKIISLTITEGGYNFDPGTGNFDIGAPFIQWDLLHPERPGTVFGYLTQALKKRREEGKPGLTILSCDNIQHNGDVCRKMLLTYMQKAEPGLVDWVQNNNSFPNSMVDRITPVTTTGDLKDLEVEFGIEDHCPVVCEPFIQWVIEDKFSNGRPEWERVGVQFVDEVTPYETMKIRLLNAGHSLLGLLGSLQGYKTIDESVRDPEFIALLRAFMDREVTPVLGKIKGIDLERYKDSLIQRFSNPNIKDHLSRICSESSAKIPKFLLPTIHEQLERGGTIKIGTSILAAWCRYLELAGTDGFDHEIQDAKADELMNAAKASVDGDSLSFVKIKSVFGDLVDSDRFVNTYLDTISHLRLQGVKETIRRLI